MNILDAQMSSAKYNNKDIIKSNIFLGLLIFVWNTVNQKALKMGPFQCPIFECNLAPLNHGQYSPITWG